MKNKTKVKMNGTGNQYWNWEEGEEGYIDGYGGTGSNQIYVVLGNRLVQCSFHAFEVITTPDHE